MMGPLQELVGVERSVNGIADELHRWVVSVHPPVVGAMHITCADESERECVLAFQRGFVQYLLPALKYSHQSAFRLSNLGGRYEWGAVRIAEQHFAVEASANQYKMMVIKVNSHVAARRENGKQIFGTMNRYRADSKCCGALHEMLNGGGLPAIDELREMFISEGKDRIAILLDENKIDPNLRPLYAAIISSRLQARKVILDIQDYTPRTPTFYIVIPCVTINRPERDSEIICGYYSADTRQTTDNVEYYGLGDDPREYQTSETNQRMKIADENVGHIRQARDHRLVAIARWRERTGGAMQKITDSRFQQLKKDYAEAKTHRNHHAKLILRTLLPVVAEVTPVTAAILLFANGAAGIHHAFRVHKLIDQLNNDDEARQVLNDIHNQIDHLKPEEAEAMVELLMREYQG